MALARAAATRRTHIKDKREPLSYEDLKVVFLAISNPSFEDEMFLAAALLGFCGMLRISEFCGTSSKVSPGYLALGHVQVVGPILEITLMSSKGDKGGERALISLKSLSSDPCPLKLLQSYVSSRPHTTKEAPLFIHRNGSPMSADWFRRKLQIECRKAGLMGLINGHSLRIGAATTAARKGIRCTELRHWDDGRATR